MLLGGSITNMRMRFIMQVGSSSTSNGQNLATNKQRYLKAAPSHPTPNVGDAIASLPHPRKQKKMMQTTGIKNHNTALATLMVGGRGGRITH